MALTDGDRVRGESTGVRGELDASATLCYMREITHRQMRNESADVLRRVADGETMLVTNNGQPAAIISPVNTDSLSILEANGALRPATSPLDSLRSLKRKPAKISTAAIIDDLRR